MDKKIIVTGGAGFIGSCIIKMLNDMGINNIYIVDNISNTEKWLNIRNKDFQEYIHKDKLHDKLSEMAGITHVIHMGACSSTTEKDFDYLYNNNVVYSKMLWNYCTSNNISFIYASSAATYGNGCMGFDDEKSIKNLNPLNGYGYSKQLMDLWVQKQVKVPKQWVGLKFFNVYGPNEYHKGNMSSVIFHGYNQIKQEGKISLFKSYKDDVKNGEQLRDFIYVKDICKVIKFLIEHENVSGIFNIGTGKAESFNSLAMALFDALNCVPNIQYIEMPENIKMKYQYYTKAEMNKLCCAGYNGGFTSLKDGVNDYVRNYLSKGCKVY